MVDTLYAWLGISSFQYTVTHTHPFNGPFLGLPRWANTRKVKTNVDFTEARDSEWVAVASAGPYASLHLAPDR